MRELLSKAKFNWQKRYIYLFKRDTAPYPQSINIEITWNCNLNCIMCPRIRGQPFKLKNKNMSFLEFKKILEEVPSCKHINIIGAGEPLTHPEFLEMLQYADSKGITVSFTTNGTLLNREKIIKLPKNITSVWFSIDSPVPEIYESIRVGSNFFTVLHNMETLGKLRRNTKIYIQTLLMRRNYKDLHNLISIAKKVNAVISFIHPIAFDNEEDKQHVHYLGEEYGKYSQKVYEEAKKQRIKVFYRPACPTQKPYACTEPWFTPTISIIGDVYPCCYIYEARGGALSFKEYYLGEYISVPMYQYRMGNVFENSLIDIWNREEFKLLRRKVIETHQPSSISLQELKNLRRSVNLNDRYSYCKVCLWRWMCAC